MKTKNDQISEVRRLRASIGILTRGGPVTINMVQDTNPVLLQGTELPAEASYVFMNPINGQGSYKNSPVSIELFFGENGRENEDITLGKFQLKDILPVYAGSRKIEMKLAVSAAQILSITLLDHTAQKYRSIGFIDISDLEPPETVPVPKTDPADQGKFLYEELSDTFLNAKPRETGIPRHGKDITQELTISFDEALHGAEKNIEAISTETCPECVGSGAQVGKTAVHCPDCQGTGWKKEEKQTDKGPAFRFTNCPTCDRDGLIIVDPCRNCQGKTWVKTKRSIRLHIPACIDSGAEVCILHQGEPGRYGGLAGHLRIAVNIAAHSFLTRTGRDISIHLPVSASLAREGGHLRVPGLEKGSFFLMSLPSGSKNDMTFKVFESDDYILTARIETYQPVLLFALPNIKKQLQAIHVWLGNAEYELSGQLNDLEVKKNLIASEEGRNEKTSDQTTQAMADSTLAPGRSPDQAEFYTRRGMVYAEKGNLERAMADYHKALELNPVYASAYDNRGTLYLLQNNLGEALVDLNKALELDPTLVHAYSNRGKVHFKQNHFRDAVEDFSKSLFLHPGDAYLSLSLGQAYQNLGENDKAIISYQEVINSSQNPKLCRQARLFLAYLRKTSYEDKVSRINEKTEPNKYVGFEELFRNAPANFTEQKDWKKWENEYVEKNVKGKGRFFSANILPQVGKIFFIVSILGEEGTNEDDTKKVAFLIEDAKLVKLGEKEGSFLIDDIKWIQLGENYTFEGRVSEFSLLDPDLAGSDNGQLIIIKGKKTDIEKE